ncbi:hypothetical protein [Curtobacterium flaccumfaciens]|uniref:hypothetical protein n=1 Tax=Curtobacterium flaccumfaciens TaxID=2035 RepID=UPI0018CDF74B|nr:hypothetical protein [Curtobacterium flaccumfaciens]
MTNNSRPPVNKQSGDPEDPEPAANPEAPPCPHHTGPVIVASNRPEPHAQIRWKEGLSAPPRLFAYLAGVASDVTRRALVIAGVALIVILSAIVALTLLVITGHGGELALLVKSVRG